jgi:uncharacterized repeat protein (TIGR01451 family)
MKMNRFLIAGIGTSLLLTTVSFSTHLLGEASWWSSQSAVAQSPQKSLLQLRLEAEKQVLTKDQQGKQKVTWQALKDQAVVQPGDILRYTLNGENTSDRQLKNINVNQPIPKGTVYVLESVVADSNTKVTYSIDGGRSFVENPTVQVKLANGQVTTRPAPDTAYTHLRFQVATIAAKKTVKVSYQTKVR